MLEALPRAGWLMRDDDFAGGQQVNDKKRGD